MFIQIWFSHLASCLTNDARPANSLENFQISFEAQLNTNASWLWFPILGNNCTYTLVSIYYGNKATIKFKSRFSRDHTRMKTSLFQWFSYDYLMVWYLVNNVPSPSRDFNFLFLAFLGFKLNANTLCVPCGILTNHRLKQKLIKNVKFFTLGSSVCELDNSP